jgi:hypothetical protein
MADVVVGMAGLPILNAATACRFVGSDEDGDDLPLTIEMAKLFLLTGAENPDVDKALWIQQMLTVLRNWHFAEMIEFASAIIKYLSSVDPMFSIAMLYNIDEDCVCVLVDANNMQNFCRAVECSMRVIAVGVDGEYPSEVIPVELLNTDETSVFNYPLGGHVERYLKKAGLRC